MEGPPSLNPQMPNLASCQKPQQGSDLTPRLPHSHMVRFYFIKDILLFTYK
jgi:hypothetical protein